ncbi:MAG: hypothetical protein LBL66_03575 [Clostridiales bacterium]|jgi:hypothetical protein|nr:hypothetical protein [Clostridiales bacterium]
MKDVAEAAKLIQAEIARIEGLPKNRTDAGHSTSWYGPLVNGARVEGLRFALNVLRDETKKA